MGGRKSLTRDVIVVTGTNNPSLVSREAVYLALEELQPGVVIQGGAAGGSECYARQWANDNNRISVTIHSNWRLSRSTSALHTRNARILSMFPSASILSFSRGSFRTSDCVKQAQKLGMEVIEK